MATAHPCACLPHRRRGVYVARYPCPCPCHHPWPCFHRRCCLLRGSAPPSPSSFPPGSCRIRLHSRPRRFCRVCRRRRRRRRQGRPRRVRWPDGVVGGCARAVLATLLSLLLLLRGGGRRWRDRGGSGFSMTRRALLWWRRIFLPVPSALMSQQGIARARERERERERRKGSVLSEGYGVDHLIAGFLCGGPQIERCVMNELPIRGLAYFTPSLKGRLDSVIDRRASLMICRESPTRASKAGENNCSAAT